MNKAMWATLVVGLGCGTVACGGDDAALDDAAWQAAEPTALDTRVAVAARGTFEVNTTVDVNALAVAPENVVEAVRMMRVFGDEPGGAIVNEADRAGVPAVKTLHDALPHAASDGLNGLITDAIVNDPRGNQVRGAMTGIADLMDATLFQFDLVSEIALPEDAGARGTAQHAFRGVDFGGVRGTLPTRITNVSDDLRVTRVPVSYAIGASSAGNARIVFGAHAFGLPLGDYMYARLDAAAHERYGVSFRQSLNHFVDCSRVAHVVASACVDLPGPVPDVCVGHERELADVCNAGLDAIDSHIRAYFAKMNIDVVRFEHGSATLRYEDAAATTVSRFDDGAWQAQINFSQGLRDVRTTFRGVKH